LEQRPQISGAREVLAACFILTLLGILYLALRPFDFRPANQVSWLEATNGLRFSLHGVVIGQPGLPEASGQTDDTPCTLELWLRPARSDFDSTILDFYEPQSPRRVRVRQYHAVIVVNLYSLAPGGKQIRSHIGQDGLHSGQLSFVTLTSGRNGTSIYFDGKLRKTISHFQISLGDLSNQLFLGTASIQGNPWTGEIHGLAIYPRELTPEDVLQSYGDWIKPGVPSDDKTNQAISKYLFAERTGDIVHDLGSAQRNLFIPKIYKVPYHSFLTPPWREFEPNLAYVWDVAENIVGFLPLGFFLGALLTLSPQNRRAVLYTALFGGGLSLCIEILQAYIPERGSGMTDVLTNTLGATLGVLLVRSTVVRSILKKFGLSGSSTVS
jgi:VanZ family protein